MTRSRTRQSRTRTKGGLTQSSSTSRLFASRKPFLEPLEELPKRHASTEGRFSIIDECNKDTDSDSDIESPLPTDDRFKNCRDVKPNFSKSVDFFNSKTPMPVSRFKIVPVESKYKRGRWDCFDYYEKESMCAKNPKISCPGPNPLFPPTPKKDRGARSLSEIVPVPLTAPPTQTISFNFEEPYDGSDRENTEPFNRSQGAVPKDSSKIVRPPPSEPKKIPNGVPIQSPEQMTPTELLQTGLEITLNTSDKKMETDENQDLKEDLSTSSNNNGTSPAMVAIDSKIEQAMDLVKTHLMFAVREEVEVLRAKIVDLESHIHHLEAENSVLKDHIPEDIMKNLNLGMSK